MSEYEEIASREHIRGRAAADPAVLNAHRALAFFGALFFFGVSLLGAFKSHQSLSWVGIPIFGLLTVFAGWSWYRYRWEGYLPPPHALVFGYDAAGEPTLVTCNAEILRGKLHGFDQLQYVLKYPLRGRVLQRFCLCFGARIDVTLSVTLKLEASTGSEVENWLRYGILPIEKHILNGLEAVCLSTPDLESLRALTLDAFATRLHTVVAGLLREQNLPLHLEVRVLSRRILENYSLLSWLYGP